MIDELTEIDETGRHVEVVQAVRPNVIERIPLFDHGLRQRDE